MVFTGTLPSKGRKQVFGFILKGIDLRAKIVYDVQPTIPPMVVSNVAEVTVAAVTILLKLMLHQQMWRQISKYLDRLVALVEALYIK